MKERPSAASATMCDETHPVTIVVIRTPVSAPKVTKPIRFSASTPSFPAVAPAFDVRPAVDQDPVPAYTSSPPCSCGVMRGVGRRKWEEGRR
jgi:hypothetical protein